MLLHLNEILTPAEVAHACETLAHAPWADGKATSGPQAARVKNNVQLPEACAATQRLQDLVLQGLQRHQVFFSAALPKHISPPLFNRYAGAANSFGDHVDSAVRYLRNGERIRSDISCTLFLSAPDAYDGGELVVADSFSDHRIKLAAGDILLYPGNTVHRVEAVTRGARLAGVFWIESMIRSHAQRRLLFDMDRHLIRLRNAVGETDPAVVGLTGTYHNLLRMWADT